MRSLKVAFFVSDINIDKLLQREVANAILKWTRENECKLIISAQGIHIIVLSYLLLDDNGRQ